MNDKMFKTADEPLTAPPKERRDFELPSMMNFAKAKQRDALDTSCSIKDDSVIMREQRQAFLKDFNKKRAGPEKKLNIN